MGAGKVKMENLVVLSSASIEGGAGEVSVLNADIYNLDLDMGVGEFTLEGRLSGTNNINAGIGELNVRLLDSKDNYIVKTSKGLGNIKIDGSNIKDNTTYGSGENTLNISGGIGSINVNFENANNR